MYKNFTLNESEREDILNQHKKKGYRTLINEQRVGPEMERELTKEDRVEMLSQAAQYLDEVIRLCKVALKGTEHENVAKEYLINRLSVCKDSSSWATYNDGIIQYMEMIDNPEEEEDDEEGEMDEQSLSKPGDADVKGMVKTVNQNTQAADARKKLAYDLAIKAKDIKMGDRVSVSNDTSLGYFDSWDGKVIKIEPTSKYGLGFTLLGANSQTYYFAESMVKSIEKPEPKNWSIVVSSFKRQDLRTL